MGFLRSSFLIQAIDEFHLGESLLKKSSAMYYKPPSQRSDILEIERVSVVLALARNGKSQGRHGRAGSIDIPPLCAVRNRRGYTFESLSSSQMFARIPF